MIQWILTALLMTAPAQTEGAQYVFPGTIARSSAEVLVVDGKNEKGEPTTLRFHVTEDTLRPPGELAAGRTVVVRYVYLDKENRAMAVRFMRPRETWPPPTFPSEVSGTKN